MSNSGNVGRTVSAEPNKTTPSNVGTEERQTGQEAAAAELALLQPKSNGPRLAIGPNHCIIIERLGDDPFGHFVSLHQRD